MKYRAISYSFSCMKDMEKSQNITQQLFIFICRLCNSTKVCRDLIRLSGVDRLVELCQNPSERNYSDAVLVSCLAVLRRLNANLESEQNAELKAILKQLKANDLVKPNLVDSFVEYSAKQESYVQSQHYVNTGCGVFKQGGQNQKYFGIRINIPKGNY